MPHDRPPQSEAELHEVLGRAVDGFAPHSHDLVHRAATRGRHLRRIRNVQLAFAAVVLVGSTGFGLAALGPAAESGPALPAASATPTPTATPTATTADTLPLLAAPTYQPGRADGAGQFGTQFAAMLPRRGTSSHPDQIGSFTDWRLTPRSSGDARERREVRAMLSFQDGKRRTALSLTLADLTAQEVMAWPCTTDAYGACARLADGSRVSTIQEATGSKPFRWAVAVLRPGGRLVRFEQFNPDGQQEAMTVSLDEMTAIALDAHWSK
ncbi:hypothetical protein GCM10020229_65280 [Kitasatospora albolonga]|uniref:hypothetical protein n=1 Tax=Kitasatospora albolonga TaxID=68173 RepID=UPI0031E7A4AF